MSTQEPKTWAEKVGAVIKSSAFTITIVVILTVAVIGLILYGVLSHKEPGFMDTTSEWSRTDFPLQVCASAYADRTICDPSDLVCENEETNLSRDASTVVSDAITVTNRRLGFAAFKLASTNCNVSVVVGAPSAAGSVEPGGSATIGFKSCDVETVDVHGEVRSLVMQHELSHCLGLAHDNYKQSIMRRTQSTTPAGEFPPRISDSDRALIRRAFAPK